MVGVGVMCDWHGSSAEDDGGRGGGGDDCDDLPHETGSRSASQWQKKCRVGASGWEGVDCSGSSYPVI